MQEDTSEWIVRTDGTLPDARLPDAAQIAEARILVAGDVMLDRYWFGEVSRISPEAPIPVVRIVRCEDRLGGAANVARNVAALGAHVSLHGVVGNDAAAECVEALLTEAGIATHLSHHSYLNTIVKLRVIGRQQHLLRVDFDDACQALHIPAELALLKRLLPDHALIVLSDYAKGSLSNVAALIALARTLHKPVLVDPKGEDFSRYANATLLTPNTSELRLIIGAWRNEEELHTKAQALRKSLAIDAMLVTRSEEGMTLFTDRAIRHFPACAREVYDVCGAGDTVIATLATMLATGAELEHAIDTANRAAGLAVGKLGAVAISRDALISASMHGR